MHAQLPPALSPRDLDVADHLPELSPTSGAHDPSANVCSSTLGVMLLAGRRHLDALLESVAAWGEAQDISWID